jgi:hypothetical protein
MAQLIARIAAGLLAALIVVSFAHAKAPDPAIEFAKSLYALKAKWGDIAETDAARAKYLTPDFAAAIKENGKYAEDLEYAVDYDPLTQSQDWDLKKLQFKVDAETADRASVKVTFTNFDRNETVRLMLAKLPEGWRLADLFNADGKSLLQEYKDLNTAARAVKAGN